MRAYTRIHVRSRVRIHAYTRTRTRASIRVRTCGRMRAPTRLGERYAVPRGAIRRITGRDTPYLFLDPLLGGEGIVAEKGGLREEKGDRVEESVEEDAREERLGPSRQECKEPTEEKEGDDEEI